MSGKTLIKLINQPTLWHYLCEVGEIQAKPGIQDLQVLQIAASLDQLIDAIRKVDMDDVRKQIAEAEAANSNE
ncbi:MAG: hypothetical protein EBR53_08800 [Actinobacteria bacterium]|nr:hypothetical protein [Actinomycetota bacterium]